MILVAIVANKEVTSSLSPVSPYSIAKLRLIRCHFSSLRAQ